LNLVSGISAAYSFMLVLSVALTTLMRYGSASDVVRAGLRLLEEHVPRITSFWETILLGARSYGGGAFAPHARLHMKVRLREGHFAQWLHLWGDTVDELFEGERAELAKAHAQRVGKAFLGRLQHLPEPAPAITGLTVTRHGPRGD